MSNHFDIYCRTCEVAGNVFHNWGDEKIAKICADLPVLAEIGRAMARLTCDLELGEPRGTHDNIDVMTPDLLTFAVAHVGHDVAARSEYGSFHDRCGGRWGRKTSACQMDERHDGPCGPRHGIRFVWVTRGVAGARQFQEIVGCLCGWPIPAGSEDPERDISDHVAMARVASSSGRVEPEGES